MSYRDLREWLEQVDAMGELRRIPGCDWNLEIGALAEVAGRGQDASALLFDNIKDYPEGHRVLVGMVESLKRAALTTNLPTDITRNEFIAAWKERLNNPKLIPPDKEELPYVVAVIELDEGPRMLSNVIGCKPEEVRCDMPVEVAFEDITDEMTLPKFRPA